MRLLILAAVNGRVFVETGRTLCLAETQAP
jgi:hypothetical protein